MTKDTWDGSPRRAFPSLDSFLYGSDEVEPLGINEISEPIFTTEGIFILRVQSEPEYQEISEIMTEKLKTESLENWLQEQKTIGGRRRLVRGELEQRYLRVGKRASKKDRSAPLSNAGKVGVS